MCLSTRAKVLYYTISWIEINIRIYPLDLIVLNAHNKHGIKTNCIIAYGFDINISNIYQFINHGMG